jgi:hypothetical protein
VEIKVEQLDESGQPWRTFVFHRRPSEVELTLDRIRRAYRTAATRVTVDGIER